MHLKSCLFLSFERLEQITATIITTTAMDNISTTTITPAVTMIGRSGISIIDVSVVVVEVVVVVSGARERWKVKINCAH